MEAQRPAPEDLAGELAGLIPTGATVAALAKCPAILGLDVVRASAASDRADDLAAAAGAILRQALIAVDGEADGPAATLLGLALGFRGSLLKRRREKAAEKLYVSLDYFRREREEPLLSVATCSGPGVDVYTHLLEALADERYSQDSAYRLRHKHRTEREREPIASRTGIHWYELHQAYRRIWTPIAALRDDLYVLLKFLRDKADWPDSADRVMNLSWRYAQFSRELERFGADHGGLWLLGDIESEVAAAGAMRRIGQHTPLGEADASWLRLTLTETPREELDPFIDLLQANKPRFEELVTAWLDWAHSCTCNLDAPDSEHCEVHLWMSYADKFVRLIDEDWYRIADYYRATEANIHGEDVRELWNDARKSSGDEISEP